MREDTSDEEGKCESVRAHMCECLLGVWYELCFHRGSQLKYKSQSRTKGCYLETHDIWNR